MPSPDPPELRQRAVELARLRQKAMDGTFLECREAVHDYLDSIGETPDITAIDDEAVYWQKDG